MRVLLVMLGLSLVDGQKSGLALDDNQGSLEADVKPQRRHLDPACTDRNLPALGMSSYTMPWEILKGKGAFSSSYNQPKDKLKFEDGTKKVVTVYEVNKQGYDSCNKNFGPCHGIANCAVQGRKPWTCVLSTLAPGEARPASCSEAEEQATEWVGAKSVFEIEFGESHLKEWDAALQKDVPVRYFIGDKCSQDQKVKATGGWKFQYQSGRHKCET